ncbi:MAG TPA: cytochrome c maturation protein CcmE [Candidatus Dormibacteraeota bacterium]|nr:cytochrome c maturation protein CcmE [Candidatus Dormibacteraeota bacterium]
MTLALKWGAPILVVAACVGYLIYSASGGSTEYYLTVSELRAHQPAGEVRVAGVVQDDVQKTDGGLHVIFTEKDITASMPVDYQGTLPDIFKPGITVVVEGKLGGDGIFHARTLLAKCPSRFSTQPYTQ